jgi:soluble lytic murein transglycosylase-like protein
MTFDRKISSLSRFERRLIASKAVLLALVVLAAPTQLFKPASVHWIEREDRGTTLDAMELLRIYPVVRKGMAEASDNSVWTVSKTILQESRRHSLDPFLVLAVIAVESGFRHSATSTYGARGLMQIRPFIAPAIAEQWRSAYRPDKQISHDHPDLENPVVNIKLGVFYLHSLRQSFRDLKLALTAYNHGPTEVKTRLVEDSDMPLDYATKVLSTYQDYRRGARRSD